MPPVQSDLATRVADLATAVDELRIATKQDIADICKEMATKQDIAGIRREMATKAELDAWGEHLNRELKQHVTAATEEIRTWFQVLDEKLVARTDGLRRDLDDHCADDRLHRRPGRRPAGR